MAKKIQNAWQVRSRLQHKHTNHNVIQKTFVEWLISSTYCGGFTDVVASDGLRKQVFVKLWSRLQTSFSRNMHCEVSMLKTPQTPTGSFRNKATL